MPGFVRWVLGIVRWVLGIVRWVLGFDFWVSGIVRWVLGFVRWVDSNCCQIYSKIGIVDLQAGQAPSSQQVGKLSAHYSHTRFYRCYNPPA